MRLSIGIIKEGKIPPDSRVPLSPCECRLLKEGYSELDLKVQASPIRCYTDDEFKAEGILVADNAPASCEKTLGLVTLRQHGVHIADDGKGVFQ